MSISTNELRHKFLEYFKERGHKICPSSSLIPSGDATLLFTNAGMTPFKGAFCGIEAPPAKRVASSQKCLRAGGKHNDLDNVGHNGRHHTFFEMMGNFSFGDYAREQAIDFAWEFVTQHLHLSTDRLLVTVLEGDEITYNIWRERIGLASDRIIQCPEVDNFWRMADTGPCGPCTEIFYDRGEHIAGSQPGTEDQDGDRFIEIWNLVIMDREVLPDGTERFLDAICIDTGLGLERVASVLQGKDSNYDIDLFTNLAADARALAGSSDVDASVYNIILDHLRALCFMCADGIYPSNEGRGYVARRIARRGMRQAWKLGKMDLISQLVPSLTREMGDHFGELKQAESTTIAALQNEERMFSTTLGRGIELFERAASSSSSLLPGQVIFELYDTYGFPVDLTLDLARERGIETDMEGYENAMQQQRSRSRKASDFKVQSMTPRQAFNTAFVGYDRMAAPAKILDLLDAEGESVNRLTGTGYAILSSTPFYARSGGQCGDTGSISFTGGRLQVLDCTKLGNAHLHHLKTADTITVGDEVTAVIDRQRRLLAMRHHSATHLLNEALLRILGEHVQQRGADLDDHHLRFDFSHPKPVSSDEIAAIEREVNAQISGAWQVETKVMPLDQAKASGAKSMADEKYGENVRVVTMGEKQFSTELCGGTHVQNTSDIGVFAIVEEASVAAGTRRIVAKVSSAAWEWMAERSAKLNDLAQAVGTSDPAKATERLDKLKERISLLEARISKLQSSGTKADYPVVSGVKVVVDRHDDMSPKELRGMLDAVFAQSANSIALVAGVVGGKVQAVARVGDGLVDKFSAGELIGDAMRPLEGRGGGSPQRAQGGATKAEGLDKALGDLRAAIIARLESQ